MPISPTSLLQERRRIGAFHAAPHFEMQEGRVCCPHDSNFLATLDGIAFGNRNAVNARVDRQQTICMSQPVNPQPHQYRCLHYAPLRSRE
jgi:hypothetical protein